jgi:hypothetical protein
MKMTTKMHDAVRDSDVGKFLSRLIREETARGGKGISGAGGNVIQQLWAAFMVGADKPCEIEYESDLCMFDAKRECIMSHAPDTVDFSVTNDILERVKVR